nr:hypothetical protein [Microbacterium barkeri]
MTHVPIGIPSRYAWPIADSVFAGTFSAAAAGRDRAALHAAADGLDLLTAWQQSFGALDLQASVAMHGSDLMFTGLASAARLRDPAVLFEWSERARHLSQQVAPGRPCMRRPMDSTS